MKPVIPVYRTSPPAGDYSTPLPLPRVGWCLTSWQILYSFLVGCWLLVVVIRSYWWFLVKFGPFEVCKRRHFKAAAPGLPSPCTLPAGAGAGAGGCWWLLVVILQPVPNPRHSPSHPPLANHPHKPRGNKTWSLWDLSNSPLLLGSRIQSLTCCVI